MTGLPPLEDSDRNLATLIAMHVRNELEQTHGRGNQLDRRDQGGEDNGLADEQMRESKHQDRPAARQFLHLTAMQIPDYWERAELSESYTELDWSRDDSDHAICRHCHQPIIRHPGDTSWVHEPQPDWNNPTPGRLGNVGCRAASFNRLGDWDESLDRRWKAAPRRG